MDAYLKNAGLLGGGGAAPAGLGSQAQGQRGQYFAGQTRAFLERQAPYASNLFEARVQGLDPADPEGECWKEVRVADMLSENSSTSYILDGWKFVYFRDPAVERVPQGAKLWFGGSCYLVCNPLSVSSVVGSAVVRQCSAVWNRLDVYGNVLAEPFVLGRMPTKGNANRAEELGIYAEHYLDCIMSRRGAGRLLRENVRMVLGQAAYAVRGVNDFSREFTGEADSVGLVYFTLYRQDPTELDDLERGVAGGRGFTWEVQVSSPPVVRVGERAAVGAASLRCGAPFLGEASYRWVSSDPSVCAVEEGAVLGVASGTCGITCTLEQNPAWSRTVEVRVEAAGAGREVRFVSPVPGQLRQYTAAVLEAACFDGGTETGEAVEFRLSGPPEGCYAASQAGNRLEVRYLYPSEVALKIEARRRAEQGGPLSPAEPDSSPGGGAKDEGRRTRETPRTAAVVIQLRGY